MIYFQNKVMKIDSNEKGGIERKQVDDDLWSRVPWEMDESVYSSLRMFKIMKVRRFNSYYMVDKKFWDPSLFLLKNELIETFYDYNYLEWHHNKSWK